MAEIYILLGSRPRDVIEFVESITPSTEKPNSVRFYIPEGIESNHPTSITTIEYPTPNTLWQFNNNSEEIFFIYLDPRGDLINELDDLRAGLVDAHISPNRIITIVDCEKSEQSRKIRDYNEACIYHSDAVLLGNRDNVSKKWVQDYQKTFSKNAIPAYFTFLKKDGKVDDAKYLLFPETLRMTQLFDIAEEVDEDSPLPVQIDATFDLNSTEDDPLDPYRHSDSEDFPQKRVPNISDLVDL